MSKVKIMQVIYALKSGAGIEELVLDLAASFNNNIFETYVVGFKSGSLEKKLDRKGIFHASLKKKNGFSPKFLRKFNQIIKTVSPHIIHSHALSPNFWSVLIGKHLHQTKNIATIHTIIENKFRFKPFYNYINIFSDKVVTVSNRVRLNYEDHFKVKNKKIELIYSGVEIPDKRFDGKKKMQLRAELKLNPKLMTAISVGRLEEPKGYKYLIRAAHILSQKGIHLNFLIVGEGSLKDDLAILVKKFGLENYFKFTGYRSDVSQLSQIADFAVMPSIREGFSIALLEFMALGLPLIVTDVGGNREAVKNEISALIVDPADPAKLSTAIERVTGNETLRKYLAQGAYEKYMQEFTRECMVESYKKIYMEVLQ